MERILIIEDEKDVNRLLAQALQDNGYETVSVYNGLDVLDILTEGQFEMVLLDLMLPYKSGDEVLKDIRKVSSIPVIVVSAKDMVRTKVDLLAAGADDYITKPFDLEEMVARVASNIRRYNSKEQPKKISYKELVLDEEAKVVTLNGQELVLTAKEYQMSSLFIKYPNKVFSKANLYETIWGEEYSGDDNVIKTHISNIRNKARAAGGKEYIETVWGLGYRLAK
ncbi:MAG: response regulator transcription factor [Lachnospiraceae bacterium]|nr:response regulator transcription factor [Lachnospiraceae bacterium]